MEVIFKKNLSSYDFPLNRVVIQHQDGTRCEFNYAFIEEDLISVDHLKYPVEIVKVYTEHNNNHWFFKEDLVYYKIEAMYKNSLFSKLKKVIEYWRFL